MIAGVIVSKTARQVDKVFDYEVPDDLRASVHIGSRVAVPFGTGGRLCEGFVLTLKAYSQAQGLKAVARLSGGEDAFDEKGAELIAWLREKTLCSYLDAARLLIPTGTGVQYTAFVRLTDMDKEQRDAALRRSPVKREIAAALEEAGGELELAELLARFKQDVRAHVRALEQMGIAVTEQRDSVHVRARTMRFVSLAVTETEAAETAESLQKRAPKQARILDLLCANECVALSDLVQLSGAGHGAVRALEQKGLVEVFEREVGRSPTDGKAADKEAFLSLTDEQERAYMALAASMEAGKPETFLLHGVTGSGKTEVYMHLIARAVSQGKTAIVLVPEISLTPMMTKRFLARFGGRVAILHSALSLGERYDEWRRIKSGAVDVVVGARSAVFAPLNNIGAIIVDEEHEATYKSELSPRYHARDVAMFRARQHGAVTVLASATPSVESYYMAQSGRYKLLELHARAGAVRMPEVYVVDMRQELENGNRSMFSDMLAHELLYNIEHGEQSILFLNRRGFSTFVSCRSCGFVAKCPHCNISLTYHRATNKLTCHYCGYTHANYKTCPECGSPYIKYFGAGTQKLEEELQKRFEGVKTVRMDMDTTATKHAHEKLLGRFERGEADVLVGTQMVAKGLDFHSVTLVGVVAADTSLYIDDYKSAERTFSLITQVCGRAGRGALEGRAIVQTYTPEHSAIVHAQKHDYAGFYRDEIKLRHAMWYPPFCEIVSILVTGADEAVTAAKAAGIARYVGARLKEEVPDRTLLLGPAAAGVSKIKDKYRYRILIKCECADRLNDILSDVIENAGKGKNRNLIRVSVDKNPGSFV